MLLLPYCRCIPGGFIVGGMLGVLTVFLYNVVVPKVASFRLTILTFVAQVFTSLVLDVLFGNGYSKATLIGGALVAAGMLVI
ncbi:MAG: DMT family transporter [Gallintestinimicrobium sp.]